MNPFAGAGLTHSEQLTLHYLQWIGFGVDQDKQEFVFHRLQTGLAPTAKCPLDFPRSRAGQFFCRLQRAGKRQ